MTELLKNLTSPSQTRFQVPISLPRPPAPIEEITDFEVPLGAPPRTLLGPPAPRGQSRFAETGQVGPGPIEGTATRTLQGERPILTFIADALAGLGGPGAAAPGQQLRQRSLEAQIGREQQLASLAVEQTERAHQRRLTRKQIELAERRLGISERAATAAAARTKLDREKFELRKILALAGQLQEDPSTGAIFRVFPDLEKPGELSREIFFQGQVRLTRSVIEKRIAEAGVNIKNLPARERAFLSIAMAEAEEANNFAPVRAAFNSISARQQRAQERRTLQSLREQVNLLASDFLSAAGGNTQTAIAQAISFAGANPESSTAKNLSSVLAAIKAGIVPFQVPNLQLGQ